jgi:L-2,4-diaminobutyric acid acetyltransferase
LNNDADAASHPEIELCMPAATDGAEVSALIWRCPPLDPNSLYCNLLQCTHFADTCVLARAGGRPVGWLAAYRLPRDPRALFVWQIAVAPDVRGAGLGERMLSHLLARSSCAGVTRLEASVTPSNAASVALFSRFAARRGARFVSEEWLDQHDHFMGRHESELRIRIAPLAAASESGRRPE